MDFTITTANVNGIRAAKRRGIDDWTAEHSPDLFALQEVRAPDPVLRDLMGDTWQIAHSECETKGRSGVAIASRTEIAVETNTVGDGPFNDSGRWVEATVTAPDGAPLTLISAYVHTGAADDEARMSEKLGFLEAMITRMEKLRSDGGHVVLSGDLNVAHTEADIKNWKGNRGKAGFLEEERAYLDQLGELGWVDLGRRHGGEGPGPYTWWSWRGQAYDNDAGWRIDYLIATPELADLAVDVFVTRAPTYAARWSDHAPLTAKFDFSGKPSSEI